MDPTITDELAPLSPELAATQYGYLTTTGRVTGKRHEIEIWFGADPERPVVYLLSGGMDRSNWVKNLRRNPLVQIRIGDSIYTGTASEPDGEDEQKAREALAAKHYGWREGPLPNEWSRNSLAVMIELQQVASRA